MCNNFLAGNAIRSARRYKALDETAVFGYCCRHEFPGKFINLKHGERLVDNYDLNIFVHTAACVTGWHMVCTFWKISWMRCNQNRFQSICYVWHCMYPFQSSEGKLACSAIRIIILLIFSFVCIETRQNGYFGYHSLVSAHISLLWAQTFMPGECLHNEVNCSLHIILLKPTC